VQETKTGSAMGRKPQALVFASGYGCIAGCSLSFKQTIEGAVYNIYGELLFKRQHPVGPHYMQSLNEALTALKQDARETGLLCVGAAMALPSVYYEEGDRVNNDLISAFSSLRPKQLMRQHFGDVPICIMQDVRAAALALYSTHGAGSLFYFYLGDGVGGTFIENEEILSGANCVAGEIGQCLVEYGGKTCTLEEAACVPSVWAALEAAGIPREKSLENPYKTGGKAPNIIDAAANTAAKAIHNLNWVVNPHRFIVEASDDFYARLIAQKATGNFGALASPIQNPLHVAHTRGGEGHTLKGIFEKTREMWLQQQVLTNTEEGEGRLWK
jgi:predicted NBD/HSP70 family sugar kinase